MKSTVLKRFQRIFILPLMIILAGFFIVLSWWAIQLYLGIEKAELNREGTVTAENLAKTGYSAFIHEDKESLKNLVQLVREKDSGIMAIAFLNLKGEKILLEGSEFDLPLDPDRLRFMSASEIQEGKYKNIFLAPIIGEKSKSIGAALVIVSKEDLNRMNRRAFMVITLIVLVVIGFNVFIYHYLIREAMRTTQIERAYDDLKKLQDQILQQEKMAAIGRLASGVGHELRNPLGAIKNAIYYIKDAIPSSNLVEQDPAIPEFIEVIETEIKNATAIIADLLDYSKVGKLHPQMTDINSLIMEVKSVLDIPSNIKVHEFLTNDLPYVLADPLRLRQVFINLATNAFQAQPNGGTLTIASGFEDNENESVVWASFRDGGIGISEDNMKKIFEPLFTTKDKGTGLGLAICSGIVEAHGGRIEVKSVLNKGSEFIVKLPMEPRRL